MCSLCFGNYGYALSASSITVNMLQYQLNWDLDESTVTRNTTILCSASVIGLAFGCMMGGGFVKNGRRRIIILFSVIGMIACILSCIPNMIVICVGRVIYGFSSGCLLIASSKILCEIVPTKLLDKGYGISTNLSINMTITFIFVFNSLIP